MEVWRSVTEEAARVLPEDIVFVVVTSSREVNHSNVSSVAEYKARCCRVETGTDVLFKIRRRTGGDQLIRFSSPVWFRLRKNNGTA